MHRNSVAYNADFDQIMLSVYEFSEVWIIDHGTTTLTVGAGGAFVFDPSASGTPVTAEATTPCS